MPEVTLSLPIIIGLVVLLVLVGAGVVYFLARSQPTMVMQLTPTGTATQTATITPTASPTGTETPAPTATPLPPVEYVVKQGDYCSTIAGLFKVSVNSIVLQNNLPADCGTLTIGQKLLVPQPTPTASPLPTSTLSAQKATEQACEKVKYTVTANDTLNTIAGTYRVDMDAIRFYNDLKGDIVYQGQVLVIPLCKRLPTPGPTATATPPPPYPAPNLLLPADGSAFLSASDTITLQWASVGTLRSNEAYRVIIEDVTNGGTPKVTEYVTDSKLIVPAKLRPVDNKPHIFRWTIQPVRQTGTTKGEGLPIYADAGTISASRVFTWIGSGNAAPVTTPTP
jgi:LysM repeat protein